MNEPKPFSIDLGSLKSRPKDATPQAIERADSAGVKLGFVDREPKGEAKRGRGRLPSPRTSQLHVWVMPDIADDIKEEHQRTGKTQGALIEEAWAAYQARRAR